MGRSILLVYTVLSLVLVPSFAFGIVVTPSFPKKPATIKKPPTLICEKMAELSPGELEAHARLAGIRGLIAKKGYEIVDPEFGGGGQSNLMLVRRADGRLVLLKVSKYPESDKARKALHSEAEAMAKVAREAKRQKKDIGVVVPELVDLTSDQLNPVLEMPLIESHPGSGKGAQTLEQVSLGGFERFPTLESRLGLLDQVIDVLKVGYDANVFHRDLKTPNILIDDAGKVWVVDYGYNSKKGHYAAMVNPQEADVTGTPGSMSSNAWQGNPTHPRDDIAGLAKVAWELVRGRTPTEDETIHRYFFGVRTGNNFPDIARAPEREGEPAAIPVASVSQLPADIYEYAALLNVARNQREDVFFRYYGNLVVKADRADKGPGKEFTVATEILGSKAAIRNFPAGLGLGPAAQDVIDNIIRGYFRHRDFAVRHDPVVGPHSKLYYNEFAARLRELKAEDPAFGAHVESIRFEREQAEAAAFQGSAP